jgi:hypothetical protein
VRYLHDGYEKEHRVDGGHDKELAVLGYGKQHRIKTNKIYYTRNNISILYKPGARVWWRNRLDFQNTMLEWGACCVGGR